MMLVKCRCLATKQSFSLIRLQVTQLDFDFLEY